MNESTVIFEELKKIQDLLDALTEKINALAVGMKICVDATNHKVKIDHFKSWPTEEECDKYDIDEMRKTLSCASDKFLSQLLEEH